MASSKPTRAFPTIKAVRTFLVEGIGLGGDYHNVKGGHWLIDSPIATPMSKWEQYRNATPMSKWEQYRKSRTSWGINVLGSFCVEIEATDGTKGFATGFLLGADPRDTNNLFEQVYRGAMFYGRKGLPVAVISVIDLALWDLIGHLRQEPVYKLIAAQAMGFIGAKVPLPYGPDEGQPGLAKNIAYLKKHRPAVGLDFPLLVDWWEECLSPDDFDGFQQLKRAHPTVKFTTGEHEYSKYGLRKLVEGRNVDILQPDVMWAGGMTELLKVAAMHQRMMSLSFRTEEYLANSPDGKSVMPVFGDLFLNEPIPE
ncbi:hypothetical protein EPUS_00161 [Endocarpon pusillum Z07020]|uniref:Enolase C-terminal domain-containing protein n=1 Tax=Endocarpon pusillum (strain Z07020 / HMAS-L-300199) TaxID=1263415 RepID=U1GSK0_ENDPU|nr:uncharacterized protein EPUS_00161 [Endocarpon pusillum Z07020]ERF75368.1 hypothetical protein EPUS_00161 [Endocarpon pusillum Z07020]